MMKVRKKVDQLFWARLWSVARATWRKWLMTTTSHLKWFASVKGKSRGDLLNPRASSWLLEPLTRLSTKQQLLSFRTNLPFATMNLRSVQTIFVHRTRSTLTSRFLITTRSQCTEWICWTALCLQLEDTKRRKQFSNRKKTTNNNSIRTSTGSHTLNISLLIRLEIKRMCSSTTCLRFRTRTLT